jgi:hypothetical protein
MKKREVNLSKLSLKALSKDSSSQIMGGRDCTEFSAGCGDVSCYCACAYAESGGSSTNGNGSANYGGGLSSPGCD